MNEVSGMEDLGVKLRGRSLPDTTGGGDTIGECMSRDALLLVLTDNHWLYTGLAALLPDLLCLHITPVTRRLPVEVFGVPRLLVAIDRRILFRGEWTALSAILAQRPDVGAVWLTPGQDITTLRQSLKQAGTVVRGLLTQMERHLLSYFVSGLNMHAVSRLTGKSVRALYRHRRNILTKTGFRRSHFLQFAHEYSPDLPDTPELRHTYQQSEGSEGKRSVSYNSRNQ